MAEYWYTQPFEEVPDPSACRAIQASVNCTVTDESISLVPICSGLDHAIAESAGRILGTALHPGRFTDEGELSFVDRLNNLNTKVRLAWRSDEPVSRDLRLYSLVAAPGEDQLSQAEWTWNASRGAAQCATLSLDGAETVVLGFADDGIRYTLVSVND